MYSIWDENNNCLSFSDTKEWCALLDLVHVPVIYTGVYDEKLIKQYQEGVKLIENLSTENLLLLSEKLPNLLKQQDIEPLNIGMTYAYDLEDQKDILNAIKNKYGENKF